MCTNNYSEHIANVNIVPPHTHPSIGWNDDTTKEDLRLSPRDHDIRDIGPLPATPTSDIPSVIPLLMRTGDE
ncbi:uncharacterized protein CANTADRAFT_26039 [Suhomyces tanzawaensis NRRL Y-17324]|uniref:Uncharacterized protein n=1 Tax=Suhomyces tanzawaensis NRRL Y-17324 TaxID=984487 RepID=A0A1E4SHF7_9ASCO|nr:uncharacterized protein CANTADRAFT_26039 [Suhomyces tanzawaensis NRRL Y-17324]ODV78926.1 hypothetical protein CANTADRAFT_26039 [Suhomyces tanzawaensis NRRL Y-17324]